MKAIVHERYGPPEVLKVKEVDKPIPKVNEVLIKVYASTVNRTDCAMLRAKPVIMRFLTGLLKPSKNILGTDFAGEIEDIGSGVTSFNIGDKVFGFDDNGVLSHAEYMTSPVDKAIAIIPPNITFKQAAASIEGAHYAYNFINKIKLKPEHKVLINGATGAIGSATIQLVKEYGCNITATCGTDNIDLVKSIGADRVIDYLKEDFTKVDETYDFVFDTVGKSSFGKCKPILKPGGIYISSELGWMAQNLFFAILKPLMGSKKVLFPLPVNIPASLNVVKKLLEKGKFKPVIDREFSIDEVKAAFKYVEKGQKIGNVIISIQ